MNQIKNTDVFQITVPLTPAYENEWVKFYPTETRLTLPLEEGGEQQSVTTEPVTVGILKTNPQIALRASIVYHYCYLLYNSSDMPNVMSLDNNDVHTPKAIHLKVDTAKETKFCELYIYSDYATLITQNEYWKLDETLKDNLKNALQQSLRAANNLVIKTAWETDGMTVAIGTDILERSIKHLSLMVPVATQYENKQVTIKKTEAKITINSFPEEGLYTVSTRTVNIGNLKDEKKTPLLAKLSLPYEYKGGTPETLIVDGGKLSGAETIKLTVNTKASHGFCVVTPGAVQSAPHSYWEFDKTQKESLAVLLQETVKTANHLFIEEAFEHRATVCVCTPPPNVTNEQNQQLSLVYQNDPKRGYSHFRGFYDSDRKCKTLDEVYNLKAAWGGTFRVKKGQPFYRYPGQVKLPKEVQTAWNSFLKEQLGDASRCSSLGYHEFACGGEILATPVFLEYLPAWPYCQNGDDFYDPDRLETFDLEEREYPSKAEPENYYTNSLGYGIIYLLPLCTAHYNERGRVYCLTEDTEGIWFKDIATLVREGAKKWK